MDYLKDLYEKAKKAVTGDQSADAEAHGYAPVSAPVSAGSAYTEAAPAGGRRRKSRKGGKRHGRRRHTVRK